MKQKSYILFLIFLFPLLSGCSLILSSIISETSKPTSTSPNTQTPAEILENAKIAMNQLDGYRWEIKTNQQLQLLKEQKKSTSIAIVNTEITNLDKFHMTIQGTVQAENGKTQSERLELYLIDTELYQKRNGSWSKKNMTAEQVRKSFRLDSTIQDPNYSFHILAERLNQHVQMKEETDRYVFTMNVNDPTLAKKYGESHFDSLLARPDVVKSQATFQSYQIELHLHKQSHQILQVSQNISISVPLMNDDILDAKANIQGFFQGEVKSISLPPEVYSGNEDVQDNPPFTTQPYDPGDKI
ncbi:DUF6612 family protein [Risungbinella massiliensis]|uniref:DUF6612 family protein n=1 Tax=Risungbinella massiliensis TaxID=1329796 RepID=UPI0005CC25EF|nr:DUF6612 family protein [Risungbinella massiliensis]